ncbi:8-oxo-dGTP diphosphatase MutT [Pseudoalteromonas tunicata]|uniref:8-oxo-dGTP diphosphatase n=1 Tax=Pseudoalteromonas tunicata D2 TaxID=87626 RepID=A4C8D7_9GAMM|nr:8-oxo-dGTP diphosphatase MutT [Pseudoalteromonas tunicata]ATC93357.1 8-oxo-dGTP diphosphatase [Pseudoalteromonas tunicata]AXT32405.1 8-oxo-dGTP diphosphatase MutT [Pseudoalteromonas tunicata]EAR28852.1 7,8-dihydro-8-oxoguanine-triphosphatase, prefers dGTP [Pseudoalteromonas tunicata D2]MDP5213535.1 8-oxo-dGTP diphosphatase MutT [Pseudoalteromonas tunicata]
MESTINPDKKVVHVAVGIIKREQDIFICKRPDDKHQGGKWEFPGGKVEKGETVTQALQRELIEEVDIHVQSSSPFMEIHHDYGDKAVQLDIHLVEDFSGEPIGLEGQQGQWVAIDKLDNFQFPAANVPILAKLIELIK